MFAQTKWFVTEGSGHVVNSIAGENRTDDGLRAWHGVRIVYLATVTGGTLRDEVEESTDRAEWATLPDLDGRPVTELVDVALEWLGTDLPQST